MPKHMQINKLTNILMVGRINAWKGQTLLVEAISKLDKPEKAGIRVTILGDVYGNQIHFKEKLVEQIEKCELQDIIHLQSFQPDADMYYDQSDIVVVPSVLPEPFGLVAVEAMRAGKPVIAARHGGLKEIVVDGSTGILFEPGDSRALADSISWLIQNPQKAYSMGLEGKKRYQQYFTEVLYVHNLSEILSASDVP